MTMVDAGRLFPEAGGIVIGEQYRADKDTIGGMPFRAAAPSTWGAGGRRPLLCFDADFGSTHGIVFAGSGGYKTTSVTIPTALKWGGSLVVLDPSREVAPMVIAHRRAAGRTVHVLDPQAPETGQFPYTPATNLLFGLREAIDMLLEEGLPQVFRRHARLAEAIRETA